MSLFCYADREIETSVIILTQNDMPIPAFDSSSYKEGKKMLESTLG